MKMKNTSSARIVFHKPYPQQEKFYASNARRIAYGGARGGGKSVALREKLIRLALDVPGIQILLVRRTYPELYNNHVLNMLSILNGVIRAKLVKYNGTTKEFVFFNGSRITLGYCAIEKDVLQYQGQQYDVIAMDEATNFTEFQYSALTECCRPSGYCAGFRPRMYITCNPGGVGHTWVKRLFIDREYKLSENPEDYEFFPAKVTDNLHIMHADPDYIRTLESIPDPQRRRAYLEGDWDIFIGQYFTEFRRETHVVKPFEYPGHWKKYIALDYGLDMLACYKIAVDVTGRAWVTQEIYKSDVIVSDAAGLIKEAMDVATAEAVYAPPDLWNRHSDTGKSTADIFSECGVYLTRTSNDRVQGWYNLHEWLNPVKNETGGKEPMLKIFDNCANLIRTLPALQYDEKNPNDCAREPHEVTHAPDAIRCFVSGCPLRARTPELKDYDEMTPEEHMDIFVNYGK